MKKYIITHKDYNRIDNYLESHCSALVWKTDYESAKRFKTLTEAKKTLKRWKISFAEIVEIS